MMAGPYAHAKRPLRILRRRLGRKRRPRPIRKDLEGWIATRWRHGLQIR